MDAIDEISKKFCVTIKRNNIEYVISIFLSLWVRLNFCRNPPRLKGKCKSVLMSDDDHICFVMLPLPPRSSHFLRFLLMVGLT